MNDPIKVAARRRNRVLHNDFARIVAERRARGIITVPLGHNLTRGLKRGLEKSTVIPSIEDYVPVRVTDTNEKRRRRKRRDCETEAPEVKSESEEERGLASERELTGDQLDGRDELGGHGLERLESRNGSRNGSQSGSQSGSGAKRRKKPGHICQLCGREYLYMKPHLQKHHPAKFDRIDPDGTLPVREVKFKMEAMLMGIDITRPGDGSFEPDEDEAFVGNRPKPAPRPLIPRALTIANNVFNLPKPLRTTMSGPMSMPCALPRDSVEIEALEPSKSRSASAFGSESSPEPRRRLMQLAQKPGLALAPSYQSHLPLAQSQQLPTLPNSTELNGQGSAEMGDSRTMTPTNMLVDNDYLPLSRNLQYPTLGSWQPLSQPLSQPQSQLSSKKFANIAPRPVDRLGPNPVWSDQTQNGSLCLFPAYKETLALSSSDNVAQMATKHVFEHSFQLGHDHFDSTRQRVGFERDETKVKIKKPQGRPRKPEELLYPGQGILQMSMSLPLIKSSVKVELDELQDAHVEAKDEPEKQDFYRVAQDQIAQNQDGEDVLDREDVLDEDEDDDATISVPDEESAAMRMAELYEDPFEA
jgi:hypothetical protein